MYIPYYVVSDTFHVDELSILYRGITNKNIHFLYQALSSKHYRKWNTKFADYPVSIRSQYLITKQSCLYFVDIVIYLMLIITIIGLTCGVLLSCKFTITSDYSMS